MYEGMALHHQHLWHRVTPVTVHWHRSEQIGDAWVDVDYRVTADVSEDDLELTTIITDDGIRVELADFIKIIGRDEYGRLVRKVEDTWRYELRFREWSES